MLPLLTTIAGPIINYFVKRSEQKTEIKKQTINRLVNSDDQLAEWEKIQAENSNDSYKITVRFLSNEIRSDGLDIIVHKKSCSTNNNCKVAKLENSLSNEIKSEILKQATMIKEEIPNPNPEYGDNFKGVMDR